ncbi:MAG: pitrilysin family protein [Planctomycetales bacterium]
MTDHLGDNMPLSAAESAPAGVQKIATIEGISQFSLPNGLQILLVPDNSKPVVTVNLTVFVGSRQEGYGEAGMAHLLEHMVFKGTPDHPQIPKALQARGAKFNGTTWVDRTNYFETLPATPDNLEFAIKLEADRMVNSLIKGEDLASEMTVVRNEFERGENSPSRILAQRMMAVAFEWHNYGKSTIGNRSDIERVPVEKLRDFYKRFYQPDNALLVVAGKFDEAQTLKMIVDAFGKIPKPTRKLDNTYTEEPPQDGERHVTLRRVGEVSVVGVVYHVPSGTHPDFAPLEVLEGMLTTPPSGRLYKALVETRKAASVSGSAYGWHDPGVLRLMAEVNKNVPPESVLDTLIDTTEGIAKSEITEKEVERSKVQLIKHRELAAADTSGIAVELSEWAAQGDWRLYFLHRDRIEAVTVEQVKAVAAKYLKQNNRTVGMFLPTEQSEKIEIPASPGIAQLLKDYKGRESGSQGEAFDVSPANIEKRTTRLTLPSGIQAAFLPKKTRGEVVEIRLSLRYGSAATLAPYATAAEFLPSMMGRGTKELDREALNDELDRNFAQLRALGVPGLATFSLQTKKKNLPRVLELLRQILREPDLDPKEFELLKQRQLASLQQDRTDPQSVGSRALLRKLTDYPATDVRYIPLIDEEIDRVRTLSIDHIRELYDQFLGGHFGQVSVVGDFDPVATKPLLEKLFENWSNPQPYSRIERGVPSHWSPTTEIIRIPEKANAVYLAGLVIPLRDDDPDYAPLALGNYILGAGALSSRLGDRIRQKEGLSYGVYSSLSADPLDQRTTVTITAISNPKNVEKVNKAVHEELKKLLAEGPTPEEVARAKQGFLERQQVARTDDADLAQKLNITLLTGRTMAYYENLEKRVERLTPQEILEALKKRIDPANFAVFEAGDIK